LTPAPNDRLPPGTRRRAPAHLDLPLLNGNSRSAWANLGDWSGATTYPAAARALAVRLGGAAGLGPGQRVLDAGVGGGEQLLVWSDLGVAHVTACDSSAAFVAAARERVSAAGLAGRIDVVLADACRLSFPAASFECVLALDAAYHFPARDAFFRHAAAALVPGGRLALTDLVLGTGARASTRQLGRLAGIPPGNLVTPDSYEARLRHAGFTDVRIQDLSAAVLDGFAGWARRQRWVLARVEPLGGWPAIALTGLLADRLHRNRRVAYVLVTAAMEAA